MRVVIASPTADWSAPLAALLRERGVDVAACSDVFDAVEQVRRHGATAAVLHAELGADDLRVAMRGIRRNEAARVLVAGPMDEVPDGAEHIAEPWAYVPICAWCAEAATVDASAAMPDVSDAGALRERLRVARHGTYHELLGVPRRASAAAIDAAAAAWTQALSPASVPSAVRDALGAELREVRAAVADAAAVLGHPEWRRVYEEAVDDD